MTKDTENTLNEYKKAYYKRELQELLNKDHQMQKLLTGQKVRQKDLCSDLMLAASMKMNKVYKIEDDSEFGLYDDESDMPLSLVLNVDIHQNIRLYVITSEQTQLLFHVNGAAVAGVQGLEISSIGFFLLHKVILFTSKDGQVFLMSPQQVRKIAVELTLEAPVSVDECIIF